MRKPRIVISLGDINGIGPEVVLKSLLDTRLLKYFHPIVVGPLAALKHYATQLGMDEQEFQPWSEPLIDGYQGPFYIDTANSPHIPIETGMISAEGGRQAMRAVEKAVDLCMEGAADAMVTAPISKEAISKAGYDHAGHTDFIAERVGSTDYVMMMLAGDLRIGLITTHMPLSDVPGHIDEQVIMEKISVIHRSLKSDFGIMRPKIALLGLNPHAGDGGVIGREEIEIIKPAIKKACSAGYLTFGPFAADGFFGNRAFQKYDAVLAMYHDQGLIPFKTLAFNSGINFTAGLPVIRTSPDHGTAYDIAGSNRASAESMRHALYLAIDLAKRRIADPAPESARAGL